MAASLLPTDRRERRIALLAMTAFVLCWEIVVITFAIPAYILPAPHAILQRLWLELHTAIVWQHIWATASVSLLAVLLAAAIGALTGWLSYHVPWFRAWTGWLLVSTQAVPVIAIAPLVFLWIPDEFWSRVCVAVVITFFPVYAATLTALQRIPRELREVASLEGVTIRTGWLWYEAALAAPVMFAGLRTSMVLATTGAVVSEYLGGRYGLGALLNIARGFFDTTLVFVAVVILILMTSAYSMLFLSLEAWVLRRADA